MIRLITGFILFASFTVQAQVRLGRLEIKANETYTITNTDIIVVDTLIMRDSAKIQLNLDKKENYIHAAVAIFGKGASIIGQGTRGDAGKPGVKGYTQQGPCKDGVKGLGGTGGTHGQNGINLFLYFTKLTINETLRIDLSGGDGGDGGKGGEGGGGSGGTKVCVGGTGGIGGDGATGGNGGNAGALTISCKQCTDTRSLLVNKILVRSFGGRAGLGGAGGKGGSAGLGNGNSTDDGKVGTRGIAGANGTPGKNGGINFE